MTKLLQNVNLKQARSDADKALRDLCVSNLSAVKRGWLTAAFWVAFNVIASNCAAAKDLQAISEFESLIFCDSGTPQPDAFVRLLIQYKALANGAKPTGSAFRHIRLNPGFQFAGQEIKAIVAGNHPLYRATGVVFKGRNVYAIAAQLESRTKRKFLRPIPTSAREQQRTIMQYDLGYYSNRISVAIEERNNDVELVCRG